jgi:hypothetical protein
MVYPKWFLRGFFSGALTTIPTSISIHFPGYCFWQAFFEKAKFEILAAICIDGAQQ